MYGNQTCAYGGRWGLTADSFLSASKRFIGQRGLVMDIFSDNGMNFVGENNKLRELYVLL